MKYDRPLIVNTLDTRTEISVVVTQAPRVVFTPCYILRALHGRESDKNEENNAPTITSSAPQVLEASEHTSYAAN